MLVVEGRAKRAAAMREALEAAPVDFVVSPARRLWSATQILAGIGIDAVLIGLDLPDSQGLSTLHELRDQAPDTPLLIVGGSREVADQALEEGADDWLTSDELEPNTLGLRILEAIKARRDPVAEESAAEVSVPSGPPTGSILLVEDDLWVRRLLRRNLENMGHRLEVFGTPQQALAWSQDTQETLDLLVCDAHPPGMQGRKLHEHLGRYFSDLKALLLGPRPLDEDLELANTAFLARPYTLDNFEETVTQLLESDDHRLAASLSEDSG
ncbi:MAG: response regulator [Persicimonas sp.]